VIGLQTPNICKFNSANAMTRDTQGLHGHNRDDDTFAALWATVPFPRIPVDAPKELRALTIEWVIPSHTSVLKIVTREMNALWIDDFTALTIRNEFTQSIAPLAATTFTFLSRDIYTRFDMAVRTLRAVLRPVFLVGNVSPLARPYVDTMLPAPGL
jgi:hypothetical protein